MRLPRIVVVILLLLISSCASKKDLVYFQKIDEVEELTNADYSPILKADDQLLITVSSIDPVAAVAFNNFRPMLAPTGQSEIESYLIANNGTIEFPQLGTLKVAGLTRLELVEMLKEKLRPFLVDPFVNVKLLNFSVTILGEVKRPGAFTINEERLTILDAIGKAGGLNIHGVRDNVLVIRETKEGKMFERIDLTSATIFESPVYYLTQNDVIYVEPNKPKINSSATSASTGVWISVTSLLIAIITLISK